MSMQSAAVGGVQNLWSKAMTSVAPILVQHAQAKVMQKADLDGSGSLDQSEFKAVMEKAAAKLGVNLVDDADQAFSTADADADGALSSEELGQVIQGFLMPSGDTQAFVQSRGDEARFAELDADGDGTLSRAEFGIAEPQAVMSTTTVTATTTVVQSTNDASAATPVEAANAAGGSSEATAAAKDANSLQDLVAGLDSDKDGQISSTELNAFVSQLSAQLEVASRLYNAKLTEGSAKLA